MTRVDVLIGRVRRDMAISNLLRIGMLAAAVACLLVGPWLSGQRNVTLALLGIAVLWMVLSYRSYAGTRLVAQSPPLIASGQYEQAERLIERALRSFSLIRSVKLMGLHHLAILRHAQQRWSDVAAICHALLSQRLGPLRGMNVPIRLTLADALLELGQLEGAQQALSGLYGQRLQLADALRLAAMQADYSARVGAWNDMLANVGAKVAMSELLPPALSARMQAMFALAAQSAGRTELANWLRRRVELVIDPAELVRQRPMLASLWPV